MGAVRVVISSNSRDVDGLVSGLIEQAKEIRKEPGCLQFEFFRGNEFPENLVQAELWESQEAYDNHWKLHGSKCIFLENPVMLQAPYHHGPTSYPRRHGVSGVEFYHHNFFQQVDGTFTPTDLSVRSESIRWPAVHSPVRIVIQMTSNPADDESYLQYSYDTRAEPGCLQFDYYRSLDFPENKLHLELWDTPPEAYDIHFLHRHLMRIWDMGAKTSPQPVERRYGKAGLEFYPLCFFSLTGEIWQPENPAERMITIRWP